MTDTNTSEELKARPYLSLEQSDKPVSIVWATPEIDRVLGYIARVSNPDNQKNKTVAQLLSSMLDEGHWSPFTMSNICLEINTTRDISRQLLRHSSIHPQEFCVSGETLITTERKNGSTAKVRIDDLYKRYISTQYWGASDNLVRVFDEQTRTLTTAKIREVFKTGVKPVYLLELDNGKKIKATEDHKFLTPSGFLPLKDLDPSSFVGSNGEAVYKNYEWLKATKEVCIVEGTGLQGIAKAAGMSSHTIRKWLKKYDLQFSKKEVAQYTEIWNKGLPTEEQPRFGKLHTDETRFKMHSSSRKEEQSNLYRTGNNLHRSWSNRVRDHWYKHKLALYTLAGGKCAQTGEKYEIHELEIDHIKPISQFPQLAYTPSNIQLLRADLHDKKTQGEIGIRNKTNTWQKVVSITYVGEEETYDLEVEHDSHNYIANGIVTHNSQRYQDVSKLPPVEPRECRMQDTKNRQASITLTGETDEEQGLAKWWEQMQVEVQHNTTDIYNKALAFGIAKEQARAILPEGLTPTRLYMNGNIRSWLTFLIQRLDWTTQKECRELAYDIEALLKQMCPEVMESFSKCRAGKNIRRVRPE